MWFPMTANISQTIFEEPSRLQAIGGQMSSDLALMLVVKACGYARSFYTSPRSVSDSVTRQSFDTTPDDQKAYMPLSTSLASRLASLFIGPRSGGLV